MSELHRRRILREERDLQRSGVDHAAERRERLRELAEGDGEERGDVPEDVDDD